MLEETEGRASEIEAIVARLLKSRCSQCARALAHEAALASSVLGLVATPECLECLSHDPNWASSIWDAGDMGCGELVMILRGRLLTLPPGGRLLVFARDTGAIEDMPAWCRLTGHKLVAAMHPAYCIQRKEN